MDKNTPFMKGMKLRVFHSWEEAEAADIQESLHQSPVERIRETVSLILRVYGVTEEDLNRRRGKLKINIIRF